MYVQRITKFKDYDETIRNSACIVKFTASWCSPCKKIGPIFIEVAEMYHQFVSFVEIDVDKANSITSYEKVQSIPYFLFYNQGVRCEKYTSQGDNAENLMSDIKSFVTEVEISKLPLDNIVDSDCSDDDEGVEPNDEYGEELESTE